MLLKGNFLLLRSFRLSQPNSLSGRKYLQNGEKLGRLQQQLRFLSTCAHEDLLPSSISNMKLPECLTRFSKSKESIQNFTFRKLRRAVFSERANVIKEWEYMKKELEQQLQGQRDLYDKITDARDKAYTTAYNHHSKIIDTKIMNLRAPAVAVDTTTVSVETTIDNVDTTFNNMGAASDNVETATNVLDSDITSDRDILVTDLSKSLTSDQLELLKKGPRFALTERIHDKSHFDMKIGFCRFAYQYKWHQHRERKEVCPMRDPMPKYPESSEICVPPPHSKDDALLRRLYDRTKKILDSIQPQQFRGNLSRKELATIKELREKPLIYLPSDKGSEFCVLEEDKYVQAGQAHLQDEATYLKVKINSCDSIEKRINAVWSNVCKRRDISFSVWRSYITRHSDLPIFYHLVKTHKKTPSLKIRPIVANVKGPTKKISWLLTQVLRPLLDSVPAHLESSLDLIHRINSVRAEDAIDEEYSYPCSFDVVALYTSIPIKDAIENAMKKISDLNYRFYCLGKDDIFDLLTVILENTFFSYRDEQYQQIKGLPMGSSISGFLAILFLDTIEKQALRCFPRCKLFARYVDDCFSLLRNEDDARELLEILNAQHGDIQFELELPNAGNKLSLLDFTVDLSNRSPIFTFYKKSARKNLFMNYSSGLPTRMKESTIRNEVKRIRDRSTEERDSERDLKEFKRILRLNGYNNKFIDNNMRTQRTRQQSENNRPTFYLSLPFISDAVDRKIKRVFRNENINIRIYRKPRTLRQALGKQRPQQACNMRNCPLRSNICLRKMVVYEIKCSCGASYIGSTVRHLHTRMKEHYSTPTSAIFKHRLSCQGSLETSILWNAKDAVDLRLKEAIRISLSKPRLNDREEGKDICSLIYV